MPLDLDFSNVPRGGTLPDGDYILLIEDATLKPSKAGDSQVMEVKFTVQDPADFNGRPFKNWISFHPDALWSARLFLEAVLGEELEAEFELNEEALAGCTVGATIKEGPEYNGRPTNQVAAWFTA